MSDVRALLAAERQARRIAHPHLTYTKNGALICNVCNLNIKSEQLWPGHLKSLNHRKNVQHNSEPRPAHPVKRKIDTVDAEADEEEEEERSYEVDSRKKPRTASQIQTPTPPSIPEEPQAVEEPVGKDDIEGTPGAQQLPSAAPQSKVDAVNDIDEVEWAAFEKDVAEISKPDYNSATIEAAPVSAAELAEQHNANTAQQREDEADAEKEDASRRMQQEFEVMEEMEDRVKRLRARREALRTKDPPRASASDVGHDDLAENVEENKEPNADAASDDDDDDDDDDEDDDDDWYG